MFRFLTKFILFGILFFSIIIIGFFLPNKKGFENMHYSIYDKHELLNRNTEKRIILVGGSSLAFGIYSPYISDSFNIEVINTAIHGGYGLKFMVDDIIPYIHENDIVILAPEYASYFNNGFYGNEILVQLIDAYPKAIQTFSLKQFYLHIGDFCKISILKLRTFSSSFFKEKKNREVGTYERKSFNKCGDIVLHWNKPKENITHKKIKGQYNKESIDYIAAFQKNISAKKATLFISYPSLNRSSYNLNKDVINELEQSLKKINIKTLGSPLSYSFNDSLYFDTRYHLSKEGQFLRTEILINDLKKHINTD